MKLTKVVFVLSTLSILSSCASHSTMRGSVAMKISDTEAHVCMGNQDVKVGDKVNAFKNNCVKGTTGTSRNSAAPVCKKEQIGTGVVTGLLNEHYSVVKFEDGVKFDEGTIIEKN